jgi:hypothetical protein
MLNTTEAGSLVVDTRIYRVKNMDRIEVPFFC